MTTQQRTRKPRHTKVAPLDLDATRQRIVDADERGEKPTFDDVMDMMDHDRLLAACVGIVMEAMVTHIETHPKQAEADAEQLDPPEQLYITPYRARAAVLKAVDAGEGIGPALGQWLQVDRAAQELFRAVFQQCNAPNTVLHLTPEPGITPAA